MRVGISAAGQPNAMNRSLSRASHRRHGDAPRKEHGQDPARSHLVAIVDDDADIREAIGGALEDEGYATIEASDGHAALKMLQRADPKPDLILLDLMMPMMDGWQLQRRLREEPELAGIPIIIMTAHAGFVRALRSAQPETLVMPKPLDLDQLLETVETYCDNERSRRD
jgi:CheY-like chemotaxis protein